METVTSFSAALIGSLNGNTVKAANIADKAIIDVSDNANKMGSSMESIQNAYQGFAKQNYTMLDNLKLGYGGTKTEMERLLADANELNKQQGIITNYSIENFADIVEAIHDVQTNMGITGTTAKEAAGTLCRSAHRIKADHVMEIVAKTIKEVIQYASLDKERFAKEIQSHIEDRQTVDFTEQRKRMTVCEKRIGELEILIAKIYEDNALGKLLDKRYTMLYNQYEGKQEQLQDEVTSTDKPVSPNYALGNGVGTSGAANLLIRFGLRIFLLNAGHKAKEDCLRGV